MVVGVIGISAAVACIVVRITDIEKKFELINDILGLVEMIVIAILLVQIH